MAGQLKVDSINADSNLSFRIANTAVAFIDSNGLRPTSGNVSLDSTGTTGVRSPAANTLAFHTAGTEDMRIDATGNVGIGTSSPAYSLDVRSTAAPAIRLSRSGSAGQIASMVFEDGTATLGTGNTTRIASDSGAISFSTGGTSGSITGGTERLRIPADAAGITFPATQAPSSDANTLDDYEEGTWTPTFNANLTAAAAYAKGRYVKIGSMVWITYSFKVGTVSGANNFEFGGLPFANIAGTADTSSDTFLFAAYSGPTVGDRGAGGYLSGGSSTIVMYDLNNNAVSTAMTNGDLTADDFVWVSGWYRTS
jgi:hypothetical protein